MGQASVQQEGCGRETSVHQVPGPPVPPRGPHAPLRPMGDVTSGGVGSTSPGRPGSVSPRGVAAALESSLTLTDLVRVGSKCLCDIRVCCRPCGKELILTEVWRPAVGGGAARPQKALWLLRGHQLAAPTLNEMGAAVFCSSCGFGSLFLSRKF